MSRVCRCCNGCCSTTDGTVTTALATLVDEPVGVRILDQRATVLACDDDELDLDAGESVLERRVLLHGARSGAPLLYGASRIVMSRLPRGAREALRRGDVAIGAVLRAHRLETFRVPLGSASGRPARAPSRISAAGPCAGGGTRSTRAGGRS